MKKTKTSTSHDHWKRLDIRKKDDGRGNGKRHSSASATQKDSPTKSSNSNSLREADHNHHTDVSRIRLDKSLDPHRNQAEPFPNRTRDTVKIKQPIMSGTIYTNPLRGSSPLQQKKIASHRVPKRSHTKSDGGSVGSNLNRLSLSDGNAPRHPYSPPPCPRSKREPPGPIPDGEDRASKRTTPQSPTSVNPTNEASAQQTQSALSSKPFSPSSSDGALPGGENGYANDYANMFLQPETRPITQDQLVNEVKGIYAGLVMVEKKCVEIDLQQSKTTNKLSDDQWQALIALHRTLLYEHHDFFLASQHPSSSLALQRLALKYAMPARMWRHGIHSFLELLRHRLPDSLDHMLSFVYLAYSMMGLLMESVPAFYGTWIECLGDLARYRMAIEEKDFQIREIWSGCAKTWYEKAADKSPDVGRIQHHLAVLARPNVVQQLFYYTKALVSVIAFQNARESIMLLFSPFLQDTEETSKKYIPVEAAFVTLHGLLFTFGSVKDYFDSVQTFLSGLDPHLGRIGPKFRTQGPEVVCSLSCAMFGYGTAESYLFKLFEDNEKKLANSPSVDPAVDDELIPKHPNVSYWNSLEAEPGGIRRVNARRPQDFSADSKFLEAEEVSSQAARVLGQTARIVTQRIGDKNMTAFLHVLLACLWGLAHVEFALLYVEAEMPWESIATCLNTIGRSGVDEKQVLSRAFPQQLSGTGKQLPEDFAIRGLIWAQYYFPRDFFSESQLPDIDERALELPSHAAPRAERCLWLGNKLAGLGRWLDYDSERKRFSVTDYARSFGKPDLNLLPESPSVKSESDVHMAD